MEEIITVITSRLSDISFRLLVQMEIKSSVLLL